MGKFSRVFLVLSMALLLASGPAHAEWRDGHGGGQHWHSGGVGWGGQHWHSGGGGWGWGAAAGVPLFALGISTLFSPPLVYAPPPVYYVPPTPVYAPPSVYYGW